MTGKKFELCLWVTPKVFDDLHDPLPGVSSFFEHYSEWIKLADPLVVNFCTGNGDHILNFAGKDSLDDEFDWARGNESSVGYTTADRRRHNLNWLKKVVEGGQLSGNPFWAGPSFLLSEQKMNYRILREIYRCFREEAHRKGIPFRLLEYLEPGPEFCKCEWKTERHPEAAVGRTIKGPDGNFGTGVIDVTTSLRADKKKYAAFPDGIAEGTNVGHFVARQCAAFAEAMDLDGIFLGNQFGLCGFWEPSNAPPSTEERREGIRQFFREMRSEMGERLIYWMDTYWRVDVEETAWAMDRGNYYQLDAVICSLFAVIGRTEEMRPNVESKLALNGPKVLYSFDHVDPWYFYRPYLHHRPQWMAQRILYREIGARCNGVTFMANDTFGHWVFEEPLKETLKVIRQTHGWQT